MTQTADAVLRQQIDRYTEVVGAHLEKGQPYALLDFPDHSNIGDSAIYAGQIAFLDRHAGRRADCVCTWNAPQDWLRRMLPAEGPILLHGGGNFGDLWQRHQTFRHQVLEACPGRKVVQLPQSIHFNDPSRIAETARRIAAHGNFTLLVRDRASYDLATAHFDCDVQMCPDAAPALWKIDTAAPSLDLLAVLRDDVEAVRGEMHDWLRAHVPTEDWVTVDVWSMPVRILWKIARSFPDSRRSMAFRESLYRRQAMQRVMAGAQQLGRAERIVTDRLHVHLIASLIRRPHMVLDNSYGKIARYLDAWGQDDMTTRVSSLDELHAAVG